MTSATCRGTITGDAKGFAVVLQWFTMVDNGQQIPTPKIVCFIMANSQFGMIFLLEQHPQMFWGRLLGVLQDPCTRM